MLNIIVAHHYQSQTEEHVQKRYYFLFACMSWGLCLFLLYLFENYIIISDSNLLWLMNPRYCGYIVSRSMGYSTRLYMVQICTYHKLYKRIRRYTIILRSPFSSYMIWSLVLGNYPWIIFIPHSINCLTGITSLFTKNSSAFYGSLLDDLITNS